ncbi:MAG: archaemetzincin [Myxococcota bacterium]
MTAYLLGLMIAAAPPPERQKALRDEKLGQTVDFYRRSFPVRPGKEWTTIYLQRIGDFSPAKQKVLEATADYVARFFGLPVKLAPALSSSEIPASARRLHPDWGVPQILTTYVMNEVLKPRRPKDAVAYIGFTAEDLWPGEGWNFVFGQASLYDRVGVWSLNRFGDPSRSKAEFRLVLLRALKTAVHELSHMLGLHHCVAFECVMNGTNHMQESDSRPLELCPLCLQKVAWNTGVDSMTRFQKLLELDEKHGLKAEAAYVRKALRILRSASHP